MLSSLCCWLRQCWRRCIGCCVVMTVQKRPKRNIKVQENIPQGNLFPLRFNINSKKLNRIELQTLQFYINSKTINLHHVKSVIMSAGMVVRTRRTMRKPRKQPNMAVPDATHCAATADVSQVRTTTVHLRVRSKVQSTSQQQPQSVPKWRPFNPCSLLPSKSQRRHLPPLSAEL